MQGNGTDPLAVGLAAGDQRAFADLYDRFAGRLYRAALGMLGCREDAEDAVQEVFGAVLRSRQSLTTVQDLTAYLFTVLRRTAGRIAVQRNRRPVLSETAIAEAAAPADSAWKSGGLDGHRLERALRTLPAEQREVIALKIDGELTFAQIGQVLGVSGNTAASRYRYGLEKLRTEMGERRGIRD